MLDRIASGRYTIYPKPIKPKRNCPECKTPFTSNFCGNCGHPVLEWYNKNVERYTDDLAQYAKDKRELHELFKKDCLEDIGINNHPQGEKLFVLCYEKFKDNSLIDVYYNLLEFSEVLR